MIAAWANTFEIDVPLEKNLILVTAGIVDYFCQIDLEQLYLPAYRFLAKHYGTMLALWLVSAIKLALACKFLKIDGGRRECRSLYYILQKLIPFR